jgi:hypothetical protein
MLPVGYDDELSDAFAPDEVRKRPSLAPGAEDSLLDRLAARAFRAENHEEMPQPRLDLSHHVHEPPVARKAKARESPPLEASDAQDEAIREALPEEAQTETLSRLAPREDENRIRRLRHLESVQSPETVEDVRHSVRMIAWE